MRQDAQDQSKIALREMADKRITQEGQINIGPDGSTLAQNFVTYAMNFNELQTLIEDSVLLAAAKITVERASRLNRSIPQEDTP